MSAAKNESQKCSQQVRSIPLERYRLPDDGRKWKQAARSRSALLLRLSIYANGDGTFVRNGRNYSPSRETLLKHVARSSFHKLTDEIRATGLLSWTRENHYDRRVYTIHLSESGPRLDGEQIQDSEITGPRFENEPEEQVQDSPKQVQHSQEQVQYSPKTGPASNTHPSLLPVEPSLTVKRKREPSTVANVKSSLPPQQTKKTPHDFGSVEAALRFVMERAKALDARVTFTKTAKVDLGIALQELGHTDKWELGAVIQARRKLCRDDDPVSFQIFGSTLASNLVSDVRELRRQNAKNEEEGVAKRWRGEFVQFLKNHAPDDTASWDVFWSEHDTLPRNVEPEDVERLEAEGLNYWCGTHRDWRPSSDWKQNHPEWHDPEPAEPTWTPEELKIAAALRSGAEPPTQALNEVGAKVRL